MKRWTWEFEEDGGYDALTSAVSIRRDGVEVFVLDRDDYPYPLSTRWPNNPRWEVRHEFSSEMK